LSLIKKIDGGGVQRVDTGIEFQYIGLLGIERSGPRDQPLSQRVIDAPVALDRGYVDFARLYTMHQAGAFFVTRAKKGMAGGSWEGWVIENLLAVAPQATQAYFYRTTAGAELDLLLDLPKRQRWAIEIKRSSAPGVSKGFHIAAEDVKTTRRFVLHSGSEPALQNLNSPHEC
jgi:hypothetical protein